MPETAWLSYVGAITGVIGAVTGIAGAAMGFISYRKTGELKQLELRLELRRRLSDLHAVVDELPALLQRAKRSRTAVAAATGRRGSGAMQHWSETWQKDLDEAEKIVSEAPEAGETYKDMVLADLEGRLASLHSQHVRALSLRDQYVSELEADNKERDHLREDMRVQTQAKLGKQ